MADYATVADVVARLGRDLTTPESTRVQALLDDAETILRARIVDLNGQVTAGRIPANVVRLVLVSMVLRVVRNPAGFRSESAGDYSYTVDSRAASGFLTVLPDEWAWLGIGDGAFSITPYAKLAEGYTEGVTYDPSWDGDQFAGPSPYWRLNRRRWAL